MVGIYMPLYDYLLSYGQALTSAQPTASRYSAYIPPLAGSLARTLAVVVVAPLELARTRQQGSAGSARTAWGALRDTLRDAAAPPPPVGRSVGAATLGAIAWQGGAGAGGGGAAASLLRGVPRLWTGVAATLGRDVPFSALYWWVGGPHAHAHARAVHYVGHAHAYRGCQACVKGALASKSHTVCSGRRRQPTVYSWCPALAAGACLGGAAPNG
jgi:hypothetical protein